MVASMVFGYLIVQIPMLFMMSFDVTPEEAVARAFFWNRVATIALMFSILLCMYGLLEITRKTHRRKITAATDFFAAAVQLYLWHAANRMADLSADFL